MDDWDWTTPEGLAEVRKSLEKSIDGWQAPAAWTVALGGEPAHVNRPDGRPSLAPVLLASVLGHDGATATLEISRAQLRDAIVALQPAEACTEVQHPNLAAWRALASAYDEHGGVLEAVFVRDLADPTTSEADRRLRERVA